MSIYEIIKEAERKNMIFMEEISFLGYGIEHAIMSDEYFIQVIKAHILYAHEEYNFDKPAAENKAIIIQLIDGDISTEEAAVQSNSIWIEFINKLRAPSEPKLNTASFRSGLPEFLKQ